MTELHRVEYPISSQYCENWTTVEALREIIANMLDARAPWECDWINGTGVFRDQGAGFAASCLMLGEGESKDGEQIGQFREGLKLALLTLARLGKRVALETTQFAVRTAAMEMTGLGKEGLVLYVDHGHKQEQGTQVRVQCDESEFKAARAMFLQLNVDVVACYEDTNGNRVFDLLDGQDSGGIYVNGLLTEGHGKWAWNYDLRGSRIKSAMNRDRTVLSRNDVNQHVSQIWFHCNDLSMARQFIDVTKQKNCAEVSAVSSGYYYQSIDSDSVWKTAIEAELGVPFETLVIDDGRTQMVRECKERKLHPFQPLVALGPAIGDWASKSIPSATEKMQTIRIEAEKKAKQKRRKKTKDFGPYTVVEWKGVPEQAMSRLNLAAAMSRKALIAIYPHGLRDHIHDPEFFVYSEDHTGAESNGCAYQGKVGIFYDYLTSDYMQIEELVGIILHEISHLQKRENIDCTREFENQLTSNLGMLAAKYCTLDVPDAIDVRYAPKSVKRMCESSIEMDELGLTVTDLESIVQFSMDYAKSEWAKEAGADWGNQKSVDRAKTLLWHYHSVVYDQRHFTSTTTGQNTSASYLFLAQGKNPSQVYAMTITVIDRKSKRINRRTVKIQYNWSPSRVRGYEISYYFQHSTTFKAMPLAEAWPEAEVLLSDGSIPSATAAQKGTHGNTEQG